MRNRGKLLGLLAIVVLSLVGAREGICQTSAAKLTRLLPDTFDESELSSLPNGEPITKSLPTENKSEVAVCGLVPLNAPAEMFLDSFRENLVRKSNAAILEIGAFGQTPSIEDLAGLTIEDRDIEDLRTCAVGDCKLKLSAMMITRLQKEIDWSSDYQNPSRQLFKQMMAEYVRDYSARGDQALITYYDKSQPVSVAEAYGELLRASPYEKFTHALQSSASSQLRLIESAIVWSKMKFGLKPVITINQISIYQSGHNSPSQILIVSKQIYASHYFESSLALTAYMTVVGSPTSDSYLFYENRSRLDGLEGPFGKIKRSVVEDRALASLTSILNDSKASLNARAAKIPENAITQMSMESISGWSVRKWSLTAIALWLGIVLLITRLRKTLPNTRRKS